MEIHSRHAQRMAEVKKGSGVFVYNGEQCDTEAIPTPKLAGKDVPVLDDEGYPVIDGTGRQVFMKQGTPLFDEETGKVIMGGKPKIKRTKLEVLEVWGVEFPAGEEVEVENSALARKLRTLPTFDEVEADEEEGEVAAAPKPAKKVKRKKPAKWGRKAKKAPKPKPEQAEDLGEEVGSDAE